MQGINFDETYTPVSKITTLRYLMCCAAQEAWEMDQLDVVTVFLNPAIAKEVYMQLPEGIEWLIAEPLSSSSSSSPADSTHKSTHNPCAEAHSVSRAEARFVKSTRTADGNSQCMSTTPGNSQHVSMMPGNSQRVSMIPGNSQHVSTTTAHDPMAMPIYMNGSLRLNKALYGLKQAPLLWHATINEFLLSIGCTRAHISKKFENS